ncbi:JmjC domain-containing protein [Frankia sp. Cr2]|uniref:JmjC domain-containing protein n=1 Tax=Frankia sp. Cr2 TaxID=3073932 RepID=UPI003A0FE114
MEHPLVRAIEAALGWSGASSLGNAFTRGHFADKTLCQRLLTPSRLLDLVMRRNLEPPQLRCFQGGVEMNPGDYLTTRFGRRGQRTRLADMNRLADLLDSGLTLVLDGLDMFDATLEVASRALQWWSREMVQVNAYLTTRATAGFPLHWDDHDVIVVQLLGEKTWDVRSFSRPAPMYRDAERNSTASEQPVWKGLLRAGDVMHIPRGYWHQATRVEHTGGMSLHVTFGFPKRTGVDWLTWLADQAREAEVFRRDLIRNGSEQERAAQERALADAAVDLLRSSPPAMFLADREGRQPPRRHTPALPADCCDEGAESVVCITEFEPAFVESGEDVIVVGGGRRLTFRKKARPALDRLLSGLPVNVAKLSVQTATDVRRLADLLVREGMCVGLTPELFSGYTALVMTEDC